MCHFLCCLVCLVATTNGKLNKNRQQASARVIYQEFKEKSYIPAARGGSSVWPVVTHINLSARRVCYSYRKSIAYHWLFCVVPCIRIERKNISLNWNFYFGVELPLASCNRISVISVHGHCNTPVWVRPASCEKKEKKNNREIGFSFINSALLVSRMKGDVMISGFI